jgi:hypothetical protein
MTFGYMLLVKMQNVSDSIFSDYWVGSSPCILHDDLRESLAISARTALHVAAENNDVDGICRLLEWGADVWESQLCNPPSQQNWLLEGFGGFWRPKIGGSLNVH